MRAPIITPVVIAAALLCALLGQQSTALAQTRSLEEGPVVRRQLLYRSDRLELEPAVAHTLNDAYRRTLFVNLSMNYHLTNTFSLGLTGGWGALNYDSNILDAINEANPDEAEQLGFADTTFLGNFHLAYVPMYGKFNLFSETTVNYDLHLIAGVGGALLSSEDNPDLEGFKFGPAFGGGLRFFFDGDTALTIDIVDHMFSAADIARSDTEPSEEFAHNVLVSIGVSFFVTGDLRVSR